MTILSMANTKLNLNNACFRKRNCEPVWLSGKALGWKAEGPLFESASALLSLQKLGLVDTVTLTINETLKWLSSLPTLMQESFWW